VRDGDGGEDGEEVHIGDFAAVHVAQGVWIDDLLAEGAAGEIGALRDVEDVGVRGFVDGAAVNRPEATEDAEERRFTAAVGANDEEVLAGGDAEVEGADEDVAVWGHDGYVDELNVGRFYDGTAATEDGGVGRG